MPTPSIKQIIHNLAFEKKLIGIGAILMVLSLFFPWYSDIDIYKSGAVYTGLTGPLYLAGFTFLIIASLSLVVLITDFLDQKIPVFNIRASNFFLPAGIFSFYLLVLINSVFFDRNFGINITLKQSQFGMFLAFVATALIIIGGYLLTRERKTILKNFQNEVDQNVLIKSPPIAMRKPGDTFRNIGSVRQDQKVEQRTLEFDNSGVINIENENR